MIRNKFTIFYNSLTNYIRPDNLFYGTSLSPAILVLRATKPVDRCNKVLVIDASDVFREGRAQNFFDPEHVEQVATWVSEFTSVEHKVSVVELSEIEAEDWKLNIPRFVQQPIEDVPPLEDALADFRQALQDTRAAESQLRAVLAETGLIQ